MAKKRAVVSLGHQCLGTTLPEQKKAVFNAARAVADMIEAEYQVAIVHSNGPQVSMIHMAMTEFGQNHADYTVAPMSVCSAMSQGYIGYDLQNAIRTELIERGIYKPVCSVLTQVCVDPYDDAFYHPAKPIGHYMSESEAQKEREKNNYVTEDEHGFRRIVASPKPMDIVEIDSINALLNANHIVIACGGGGIPVIRQNIRLRGASAVIEKDAAAALLAAMLDADVLTIVTGVEKVELNFGTPQAEPIESMTVEEARTYMEQGQFPESTMGPKIEAAIRFCSLSPDKETVITDMNHVDQAMRGKTGTHIRA